MDAKKTVTATVALLALAAAMCSAKELQRIPHFLKDHVCPDGQQTCLDGQPCCRFDSSGYGCCSGGETEACCADDTGGVCCVSQPTRCIAKDASTPYPARCCPRETVGCTGGTVGCCNPARTWQRGPPLNPNPPLKTLKTTIRKPRPFLETKQTIEEPMSEAVSEVVLLHMQQRAEFAANPSKTKGTSSPSVAYALMVGGLSGNLMAYTLNITSGAVLNKADVAYNNWGESTRDFCYDATNNMFYTLDVNFTVYPDGSRPKTGRPVTLSKIDPTTGALTSVAVTGGLVDYVTGYSFHDASGRIHVASESYASDGKTVSGWDFFFVDPKSGAATKIGTVERDVKNETDAAFYAGYHRSISDDATRAYRVGYRSVVEQTDGGLGTVNMPKEGENGVPSASWSDAPVPDGYDFYLGALSAGDESFLSLAPSLSTSHLDLVEWSLKGAKVVATLGNVTGPRSYGGKGTLGFTLDSYRRSTGTYVALVDAYSNVPVPLPGTWDQWALATVSGLSKGGTPKVAVVNLSPGMLEGSTSISGLGLPHLK